MLDVLVLGKGPAALAAAAALGARGLRAGVVGPPGPPRWTAQYGVWADEMDAVGLAEVAGSRWDRVSAGFGGGRTRVLPRAYVRVDRDALARVLEERCGRAGVRWLDGEAAAAEHGPAGSTVRLRGGGTVEGRVVVDASGHRPALVRRGARPAQGFQTAWGAVVPGTVPGVEPDCATLMDWDDAGLPPSPVPTFLYALPFADGSVFVEETALVARPALPFDVLEARLRARLAARGVAVPEGGERELCRIPMGGPLPSPRQRVVGFGGAAGMVHPATGYLLARVLADAPALAGALADGLGRPGGSPARAPARRTGGGATRSSASGWRRCSGWTPPTSATSSPPSSTSPRRSGGATWATASPPRSWPASWPASSPAPPAGSAPGWRRRRSGPRGSGWPGRSRRRGADARPPVHDFRVYNLCPIVVRAQGRPGGRPRRDDSMTPSGQAAAETVPRTAPPRAAPRVRAAPAGRPSLALVGSLRSTLCLPGVEALMDRLAGEAGGEPAGSMVRAHLAAGGKRIRARLALAALEALDEPREAGVAWAAACELLHNATLVHDDLQDGDRVRRGHPTVWALHGMPQAVNAGDLLLMLPYLALEGLDAGPDRRWTLALALAGHAAAVVRGQAAELALGPWSEAGWPEYRAIAEGKTGALFQLPVEGAAVLAGRPADEARRLAGPFRALGLLFQLQDDVLDLFGDKGRGAPGSDLREGKTSALVVEHLALHPADAPWLRALLAAPRCETPQAEVELAMERFRTGGALARVLARIDDAAAEAVRSPALAEEPGLRRLAAELAAVALLPIEGARREARP
ncbi:MAG TPA: lycopene cyclase family protein [Longimicrobiaceae bacterium]|nr:lycopene cyclase family protein [Longimicrobiaceae bacterium]